MSAKLAAINPTPATGQALRKVFALLEDNFDTDAGQFRNDYSDERIAKETGISIDAVKNYRVSAFGKLKPPTELYNIQAQLRDLETLYLKTETEMKAGLKDLKARVAAVQRKFD
jgi:hypothetical protein